MAQIIPTNIQLIENLNDTVYISNKPEGNNGSCVSIPMFSGPTQVSAQSPILNGGGVTMGWQFTVPEGSVVNTANSYIRYRVKYVFNCKYYDAVANNGDQVQVPTTANKLVDPESQTFLAPGHYYVKDNILWCEPAIVPDKTVLTGIKSFGSPVAICQFPMNSSVILNQSTLRYGNVSQTDDDIFIQRGLVQSNLSEEYQAGSGVQFFEQNTDTVIEFYNMSWVKPNAGTPGSWTIPANAETAYTHVLYKDYFISLNMINQLLDIKGKFYTLGFTRQMVQLFIKLQPYSMAKLFFTEQICNPQQTGITDIQLKLYCKSSAALPSMLQQKDVFVQQYDKYCRDPLPIQNGLTSSQVYTLSSGHTSTNEIILGLIQEDTTRVDSTFLKQRYTLMNSSQIINYWNGQLPFKRFVFFNNLNIYRGNQAARYFSDDLNTVSEMKHELLRSINMFQQYETSPSQAMNDIMKMMTKYAMIRVNLEAFKQESLADKEVLYDGYTSTTQRVQIKTSYKLYDLDTGSTLNPNAGDQQIGEGDTKPTVNLADVFVESGSSNVYAYQYYDQFMILQPKTGALTVTEDVQI